MSCAKEHAGLNAGGVYRLTGAGDRIAAPFAVLDNAREARFTTLLFTGSRSPPPVRDPDVNGVLRGRRANAQAADLEEICKYGYFLTKAPRAPCRRRREARFGNSSTELSTIRVDKGENRLGASTWITFMRDD